VLLFLENLQPLASELESMFMLRRRRRNTALQEKGFCASREDAESLVLCRKIPFLEEQNP
jgi:hypothetical protein